MVPVTVPATNTSLRLISLCLEKDRQLNGALLDIWHNLLPSYSGEFRDGREANTAAYGWDIGERLEDLWVGGSLAVVEQNHGAQSGVSGDKSRNGMGLIVIDV